MKIKIDIKSLMLLVFVFLIGVSAVPAQKKQTAAKLPVWEEVKMEKWGLKFSIPKDLKEILQPEEEPTIAGGDFTESRDFKRLTPAASRLDLLIMLRNFPGETVKTENQGKEYNMTPKDMLLLEYIGDSRDLESPESPTIEANYHTIDGVEGVFALRNLTPGAKKTLKATNKILVVWGTYRLFKGNVQQITFGLEGKRTQLETMKKIINSIKFNL